MTRGKEANFFLVIQYWNLNIQYWYSTIFHKEQLFFPQAPSSFASDLYQTPQF